MQSYQNSQAIKQSFVDTALEHERADSFVKGLYWQREEKKGCNIGCWTKAETGNHAVLALEMGVPESLLHLSDGLFEALPDPHYKAWSRRLALAIPVGVDLSSNWAQVLRWILSDQSWGLGVLAESMNTRAALKAMADYYGHVEGASAPEPSDELTLAMLQLKRDLAMWRQWDEQALRDMRAARAAIELWNARTNDPKSLARAAWAARAAWSAWEAYTLAQSDAVLEILKAAQPEKMLVGA